MKCPVCRAAYRPTPERRCHRCRADLTALVQIHDQACAHYDRAIHLFQQGDLVAAMTATAAAIALNSRCADFHVLAGKLWAGLGRNDRAVAAWRTALALDEACLPPWLRELLAQAYYY